MILECGGVGVFNNTIARSANKSSYFSIPDHRPDGVARIDDGVNNRTEKPSCSATSQAFFTISSIVVTVSILAPCTPHASVSSRSVERSGDRPAILPFYLSYHLIISCMSFMGVMTEIKPKDIDTSQKQGFNYLRLGGGRP